VAVYAAIGGASRRGLLVKGGLYLERLGRVDTVAFDKTGTLTSGKLRVSGLVAEEGSSEGELLAVGAAVEASSEHPAGRAVVDEAVRRGLITAPAAGFRSHPGAGVEAMVAGRRILAGNLRWLAEEGVALPPAAVASADRLGADGFSIVGLARDGRYLGLLTLSDTIRPDAQGALGRLRAMGVRTWLLSGDSPGAARRIASELGITEHAGGLLPGDKVKAVTRLAERHSVAMVGDGINDAPALAAASVGIAVGRGGSDLAIEAADVVLLSNELGRVADALELGRRTLSNIRFNIALSGVSIAGLFAAAALGYVGPWRARSSTRAARCWLP